MSNKHYEYEKRLCGILCELYQRSGESKEQAQNLAENAVDYMNKPDDTPLQNDISVRLVKGGTYKIKSYYLENNKLPDIRGASAIITEVQEKIVPELLNRIIGFDCIVYNGGGNLFAVVPEKCDKNTGNLLEAEAQKYLITANTAYFLSERISLSKLLGKNYKNIIASKESELEERKKSKVQYVPAPVTQFLDKELMGIEIKADKIVEGYEYCDRCGKRKALYYKKGQPVCGGCLHKTAVGASEKRKYISEYVNYANHQIGGSDETFRVKMNTDFKDIDDSHIAVFYADGNNMGGIIQGFDKLTDMMDFSDFVKKSMPEIVYSSLYKQDIRNVEFTALGGDDVFIIVPGRKAIRLAVEMIERYNAAFRSKSTLSVGICIAKPNTPVKIMLEAAEEQLKAAKRLVRETDCKGSLSYVIFDSYEGVTGDRGRWTLLPYSLDSAKQILLYADKMKNDTAKTRLRNISHAFQNAESDEESELFFSYLNAKETDTNKRIRLPDIDGYERNGCFYRKYDKETGYKKCCIWDDLLDLIEFSD